jgi:predicted nucleic acid-binding protein
MPADPTFVDTNVLVYAHDRSERTKQPVAQEILEALWSSRTGTTSTQVLQEFYVVATRKFRPPMGRRDAREVVAAYDEWGPILIDVPLIVAASNLEERHQLSFWDAMIVEAARRVGATVLLTEDLQAGRRFDDLVVANPFG